MVRRMSTGSRQQLLRQRDKWQDRQADDRYLAERDIQKSERTIQL